MRRLGDTPFLMITWYVIVYELSVSLPILLADNNKTPGYHRALITDRTITMHPNQCGYLLQQWNVECNDKNGDGKVTNFMNSAISTTPTRSS